ncbi:hypothetical protein MYX07_07200, partial [Patescibacteria group bacterium AH-259-L07]|nr:hypothetical protein [Patescibacteria group bacterium AH-259-L07]
MAKKNIKQLNLRLLLNAEPFGYGPTAAIAAFFPYLRKHFAHIGYIGKGHTLDLQRDLKYDVVHDIFNLPPKKEQEVMRSVVSGYDIFFTALDFSMAGIAKTSGLRVYIYDPLTWYWKKIPTIVQRSDLYVAQDFFGVKSRLRKDAEKFPKSHYVVPSIIPHTKPQRSAKLILINLGGLHNPLWSQKTAITFARIIIQTFRKSLPEKESIIIATSDSVAKEFKDPSVKSFPFKAIQRILSHTKLAFMTSGLGNIYDSARYGIPTVWLPPANDSQGQQATLLKRYNMSDGSIDWNDILPNVKINYKGHQPYILKKITDAIDVVARNRSAQDNLVD